MAILRGILFDLDGTLFDRETSVRELVLEQHRLFATALACVPGETYVARVLELDAHGHRDKTALYQQVAADFALSEALAVKLTSQFWETYHSFCRSFPDVLPVLARLRARGLKLGIITNGAVHVQEPVIQRLGLAPLMDAVLISEREGVRKPHREIFLRALRALDLRADETWYVGDHPTIDVEGAVAAGLTAVWRRTPYWPEAHVPHRQIDRLDELLSIVAENP